MYAAAGKPEEDAAQRKKDHLWTDTTQPDEPSHGCRTNSDVYPEASPGRVLFESSPIRAEALAYERVLAMVQNPIGKGLVFLAVFLPAWHAAHRLRITAHDFGIRADTAVMTVCYGLAALATLVAVVSLIRI